MKVKHVTILAFDQSLNMGVAMSHDIFHAAMRLLHKKREYTHGTVEMATQDGKPVKTFSGSIINPHRSIETIEHTDLILICGFWGDVQPFLDRHQPAITWLEKQYRQGTIVGCLSSGTFLPAEAGLLDGKVGTVYWRMVDEFRKRYPKVLLQPERAITVADNLFCSAGVASGCNLSLYLIERIWGLEVAQKVSKNFLMDIHPESNTARLTLDGLKYHDDNQILKAQEWMEDNFSYNFLIEEVANRFNMSLRNFSRRFKRATGDSPLRYQQSIRIEVAKDLLHNRSLSIEQISFRVGYEDVSFFCRLFRRLIGLSPAAYRKAYTV